MNLYILQTLSPGQARTKQCSSNSASQSPFVHLDLLKAVGKKWDNLSTGAGFLLSTVGVIKTYLLAKVDPQQSLHDEKVPKIHASKMGKNQRLRVMASVLIATIE